MKLQFGNIWKIKRYVALFEVSIIKTLFYSLCSRPKRE